MTREEACKKINEAIEAYSHIGKVISYEKYGNGHINDTFLAQTNEKRYILQRINNYVFTKPWEIMENIDNVSSMIRKRVELEGGDTERASLTVVKTDTGNLFYKDSIESYWRIYDFVEGTVARDTIECPDDFRICAEAFGKFQGQLSDFPVETLYEGIKDFHNTPVRYENLIKSCEKDAVGRAMSVENEINFVKERKDFCSILENARKNGELPLRVTHNDTKLNNILFDAKTGEAVCVIDLDTVMSGFSVTDFGDSIRFGANTALEDEDDLSKVSLDLNLFEIFAKGYIKGCSGRLTEKEIDLLPEGAIMMTLECGIRFLTDYLDGDIYFRIHKENTNLIRARNQFALVLDMEKKLQQMKTIVHGLK